MACIWMVRGNAVGAGVQRRENEKGEGRKRADEGKGGRGYMVRWMHGERKGRKKREGRVKGARGAGGLGVVVCLDRGGEGAVGKVKGEGGRACGLGMVRKERGRGSLRSLGPMEEEGGGQNRVSRACGG
ncbi:hypothetical protein V6Z11_A11G237600 [Gossypium hirsutum]